MKNENLTYKKTNVIQIKLEYCILSKDDSINHFVEKGWVDYSTAKKHIKNEQLFIDVISESEQSFGGIFASIGIPQPKKRNKIGYLIFNLIEDANRQFNSKEIFKTEDTFIYNCKCFDVNGEEVNYTNLTKFDNILKDYNQNDVEVDWFVLRYENEKMVLAKAKYNSETGEELKGNRLHIIEESISYPRFKN